MVAAWVRRDPVHEKHPRWPGRGFMMVPLSRHVYFTTIESLLEPSTSHLGQLLTVLVSLH